MALPCALRGSERCRWSGSMWMRLWPSARKRSRARYFCCWSAKRFLRRERERHLSPRSCTERYASGQRVVVVISGGNMDVTLLARIIERGLVKDGRLVRLRVHLPDYPGALHALTAVLAEHRANLVETSYDRAYHGVNLGDTAIDITMETRGPEHIAELIAALGTAGYVHERIL